MTTTRPVRIPRGSAGPRPAGSAGPLLDRRVNVAGTQRAFRFAVLYLVVLLALDLVLVGLDLGSSEASRPGVQSGLQLFIGVAVLLAVGSVVYALTPAPRYIEIRPESVVVVGRWGGRVGLPPLGSLRATVARHYPAGFLSHAPVDLVQVVDTGGRRRTYQVEAGLFEGPPA